MNFVAGTQQTTFDIALRYDGMSKFSIQSLFWETERPDIQRKTRDNGVELKDNYELALWIIDNVIWRLQDAFPAGLELRRRRQAPIQDIGTTPISTKTSLDISNYF